MECASRCGVVRREVDGEPLEGQEGGHVEALVEAAATLINDIVRLGHTVPLGHMVRLGHMATSSL